MGGQRPKGAVLQAFEENVRVADPMHVPTEVVLNRERPIHEIMRELRKTPEAA